MINNDYNNAESVMNSPAFRGIFREVAGHTVVTQDRLLIVYELSKNYGMFPAAEVGVFKGGTAFIILRHNFKKVYLIDTFEGMPETLDYEPHKKGDFSNVSLDEVTKYLEPHRNKVIIKGNFSEVKSSIPNDTEFGFVHLDADIYTTTKECLEFFYPKMVKGGSILLDDFDFRTTPGCKKAVLEFMSDKPEYCISLGTGQGLIIKQ